MASNLIVSTIALCVIVVIGGTAYLINTSDSGSDLFSCSFEKMKNHYTVTRRELSREGNTIFVSREGREFMFSRRFLVLPCIEQSDE